ncbi:unnamed protein product [Candidula unifasciata]|uniref:Small ribosomal subunit protein uS9 n=1 Tax=Candidula unifasciata TaxID=100452 RepID=A0A8S3ZZ59_9EUPU|nr:unnamed protein product [Candidula unifasciata]
MVRLSDFYNRTSGRKAERKTKKGMPAVQVFGRKKTTTALAHCKRGNGLIKVNGRPLDQMEAEIPRGKLQEPVLFLGKERFSGVDIRIYAIKKAISKVIVSYNQKICGEAFKIEIRHVLTQCGRSLLVADPRLCEVSWS